MFNNKGEWWQVGTRNEPPISHTRQTPTKTEGDSSDHHSNQTRHPHWQATSYTQANIGDPVINRQYIGSQKESTACIFIMKNNFNTLENYVCWKILVHWEILLTIFLLFHYGLIVLHKTFDPHSLYWWKRIVVHRCVDFFVTKFFIFKLRPINVVFLASGVRYTSLSID